MKKHFLAIAALIIAAFTGCQKEQSEFTTESLQGTCTLQGKITYDKGVTADDLVTHIESKASGVTVVLSFDYSAYATGATGKKYYTTTTDEDGNYSFTVAVGSNPISASNVEIGIAPFEKTYGFVNTDSEFTIEQRLYTIFTPASATFENYQVVVRNLYVKCE